jgi:phosphoribosylformylglycinamidine (FGAM) synthase-like enzyme
MTSTPQISGTSFFCPSERQHFNNFVEVGPFEESGLLNELNRFFGLQLKSLIRVNSYLFVHDQPWSEPVEILSDGLPFVDRVVQRATVNRSLFATLQREADTVLISMLRPGTSDAEGEVALDQALSRLARERQAGDQGYLVRQFFIEGQIPESNKKAVFDFLSNPELCAQFVFSYSEYQVGVQIPLPIVELSESLDNAAVEYIPVQSMALSELQQLNIKRSLAASDLELLQFKELYSDAEFLSKRAELGLPESATDVEIETWFGLRSEHCFHKEFSARIELSSDSPDALFERAVTEGVLTKTSAGNYVLEEGIFKTFIRIPAVEIEGKLQQRGCNWIASMFSDNAGVAYYDDRFMFAIKVETHNSPSNKEPVQGAKTGLNGNFRDIMGTMRGSFDILSGGFLYCTGNPDYHGWLPAGVKHPYVLLRGITQGVREAGNEMQVPTLWGQVVVDPRYIAKCMVFAGAVGWSPVMSENQRIDYRTKNPQIGDLVLIAGQPVGIDGIHGATESSLSASAQISLGHVQADFSFIQAKVKEFVLEASRLGLFSAVTDCGAMGLGSSSHEIARDTGGLDMDLAQHPLKYKGIKPWQINCSETQDRMLLIVHPENRAKVFNLAARYKVEVAEMGTLNDSGYVKLRYKEQVVGLLDINKLFSKEPRKEMRGRWMGSSLNSVFGTEGQFDLAQEIRQTDFSHLIDLLLAEPDLASKEWFFRQKDFSVKGGTILGPLAGLDLSVDTDVSIQKPLDTEGYDFGALAYAWGVAPKQTDHDPYFASQNSFLEAVGKLIAAGARLPDFDQARWDSWAVCGNYCQPNSDFETALFKDQAQHNLACLVREGMGVREVINQLGIPVISGKDSMKCSCVYSVGKDFNFNTIDPELRHHVQFDANAGKIEIHDPETYLVTACAKIEDYRKSVDSAFKRPGDLVLILGTSRRQFAGTQIESALLRAHNFAKRPLRGEMPMANISQFINSCHLLEKLQSQQLLSSSSYVAAGGIIYSLFKSCWSGGYGAELDFINEVPEASGANISWQELLVSETPGRFMISIDPADLEKVLALAGDLPLYKIGQVGGHPSVAIKTAKGGLYLDLKHHREAYRKQFAFGLGEKQNG